MANMKRVELLYIILLICVIFALAPHLNQEVDAEEQLETRLTVRVADTLNRGLDAKIYLDSTYRGTTGSDGKYTISDLSPGSYYIKASKEGYLTNSKSVFFSSSGKLITITLKKEHKPPKKENDPPKAYFTYTPENPTTGDKVKFNANNSKDPDGYIDDYKWNFGDYSHTSKENPTHRYEDSGAYNVQLTVTDNQGETARTTKEIIVKENLAKLSIGITDDSGKDLNAKIYLNETFKGRTGEDGSHRVTDLSPKSYTIKAGKKGYYSDSVSVYLSAGEEEHISFSLKNKNTPPEPSFTYSPKRPKIGQQITLAATTSSDPDGKIQKYNWDLTGDGTTDKSGSNVNYTYDRQDTYTVKLTVTDDTGASSSTTKQITVTKKEKPQPEAKIEEKYGLVIGISKYKDDLIRHLSYSKEDAEAFYSFLTEDGNFSEDKVSLLLNDQATTEAIEKAFSNLITEVEKNDLVLVYYSGHGTYGPDYNNDEEDGHDEYYVTYDTDTSDGDSLFNTGISDDQFGNWINSLQSDKVAIVLDSCYSGGATKSAKTTNLPTHTGKAGPTNTVFNDFSFEDRLLFAASGENQQSFEAPPSADFNHGVFTHFMLKGLKGAADKDNDGNITAEEVYSYVKPQVQEYVANTFSSYHQTPLMKGVSTIPLVTREEKLTGKVKYVKGEDNTKAIKDEFVVLNLGNKDGVRTGDKFKVFFTDEEAGTFREINGTLEIKEIIGSHLALGKVIKADYLIKKGDRVEKVKK